MKILKLPVVLTDGEDGYFVAEIPVLPGCISQGKTRQEALANIKEAAELCIECQPDEDWHIPENYYIEQVEVGIA